VEALRRRPPNRAIWIDVNAVCRLRVFERNRGNSLLPFPIFAL
jgi:hypothetical protein